MSEAHEKSYIRGAGADGIDSRRVVGVVAVLVVAALVAVTAYLFASTSSDNSSANDLARSGMAVAATITGCEGISDGVGMGVEYYDCTAQVSVDGRSYRGLLHGNRVSRPAGSQVPAVMVPGDIDTLTVDRTRPSSYAAGWIMSAVTLAVCAGAAVTAAKMRRLRRRGAVALCRPDRAGPGPC